MSWHNAQLDSFQDPEALQSQTSYLMLTHHGTLKINRLTDDLIRQTLTSSNPGKMLHLLKNKDCLWVKIYEYKKTLMTTLALMASSGILEIAPKMWIGEFVNCAHGVTVVVALMQQICGISVWKGFLFTFMVHFSLCRFFFLSLEASKVHLRLHLCLLGSTCPHNSHRVFLFSKKQEHQSVLTSYQ